MKQEFSAALTEAALAAFRRRVAHYGDEQFYSVALFSSPQYGYFFDTTSTYEGLRKVALEYLERYPHMYGTLDEAMRELKWSPCDSPHHLHDDRFFDRVNELLNDDWRPIVDGGTEQEYHAAFIAIHDAAVSALMRVQESGIFRTAEIVYNILIGDQSDEERLLNAERLNSPDVLAQYRRELEIDDHRLAHLRRTRGY